MYNLKFKQSVTKDLKKIGQKEGEKLLKAIREKLLPDPSCGKRLKGNLAAVWSFSNASAICAACSGCGLTVTPRLGLSARAVAVSVVD